MRKPEFVGIYANSKDADQPAHPCSLISAFVNHSPESMYVNILMRLCISVGSYKPYLVGKPKTVFLTF